MVAAKQQIIQQLQKDILRLQGIRTFDNGSRQTFGLGDVEQAFPGGVIPTGTVHEFLCFEAEHKAATGGFISGLLSTLMHNNGVCIWVSSSRMLFPMGLSIFNIAPHHVIFIDVKREKDILWATEEALKCDGLAAVVTELKEMSFTQSRRLQLAVEQSKVTGFILRNDPLKLTTSACAARWQITSLPSELEGDMPGVGFPRWNVELLKVRNGNPGAWQVEWRGGKFTAIAQQATSEEIHTYTRKAG
ncbi:ImuA family protein [Mucilaginibacter ginkgonis]|uniref:Error-prone repair protein ImuA n=1 Tax=Mucilaginibacter ginkgonis TaxID=2682091 RepID=A0A6I4I182_9SPHI|nr:Error-prone repair protein ImuA [Mucilaginibacter ginkgonis]QQL51250.1 Error-prone repair protein ImuA [Mucilaginibacter ginkgonis]